MTEISFFQLTDAGCVQHENQDAVGAWPHDDGMVFAVADGLGGTPVGQVASQLALDVLARELEDAPAAWGLPKRLRRAVQEANLEIYTKGVTVPDLRRMGSTLTVSAVAAGTLTAAHVGDTRLYLYRDRTLAQLTKDHTWVEEQVGYGLLAPADARAHPRRGVLTRCLGHELVVAIDVLTIELRPGDVLLHCSDGLHELLADAELAETLAAHDPEAACRALIRRGREERGTGDLSAQVAAVRRCPAPVRSWWRLGR